MNQVSKSLRPMIIVFVLMSGFFIFGGKLLLRKGIDQNVVIVGNLVMFAVSVLAFILTRPSLDNSNPHRFVRAVYTSFIVKFFIVVIAAFVYFQLVDEVNKPALFVAMALYFIYTFIEVSALLRLMKGKKNA